MVMPSSLYKFSVTLDLWGPIKPLTGSPTSSNAPQKIIRSQNSRQNKGPQLFVRNPRNATKPNKLRGKTRMSGPTKNADQFPDRGASSSSRPFFGIFQVETCRRIADETAAKGGTLPSISVQRLQLPPSPSTTRQQF